VSWAATTRDGRDGTIKWAFDEEEDGEVFEVLPDAKTVVITFPITKSGASERLVKGYVETRKGLSKDDVGFIQLGSTGNWDVSCSCFILVSHVTSYRANERRAFQSHSKLLQPQHRSNTNGTTAIRHASPPHAPLPNPNYSL